MRPSDPVARPSVSIGLPVYNGERSLATAIGSILEQTHRDLELIVSDNSSTDGTEAIARAFAQRDPRIRYVRNPSNIGPIANFNQTFRLARGTYFKWLGADDVCRPAYVERCLEVLESDPSTVICTSRFDEIDENGDRLRPQPYELDLSESAPHKRLSALMGSDRGHALLYGLIRSSILNETALMAPYHGSDRALLAELLLHGRLRVVPEVLWLSRDHPGRSLYVRTKLPGWQPSGSGGPAIPHLAIAAEMMRVIRRAPLSESERARCMLALAWSLSKRSGRLIPVFVREVVNLVAQRVALGGSRSRLQ